MNIDAHQHFWQYTPDAYPWIRTDALKRDFMPEDLTPLLADTGFDGTVAVQARSTVEETAWLLDLADRYPFIAGVVGWLDVTALDLPTQLACFAAHPKFCGVRCGIEATPDDASRPSAAFVRGLCALADCDKTFDLLIRPAQLPLACAVAEAVPTLRCVLDHIANPDINGDIAPEWTEGIRRLAAYPNVTCKLSGMVTRTIQPPNDRGEQTNLTTFAPYLDRIFEAFGPERLMIGSDWPVCTQAASYRQTMDIVQDYIARISPQEQAAILGKTAKQTYKRPGTGQ